jgi:hypothetical protein
MVMRNKRGWIRILEATIAVMLVSGVLVVVYSRQTDRGIAPADYFYSLQRQVLADIASRTDLRLAVLSVVEENDNDASFFMIDNFVKGKVPEAFGYSLQICDLGSLTDNCKMDSGVYISTIEKDIFVEEIIISSELGNGSNPRIIPRKLKFFIWEKR